MRRFFGFMAYAPFIVVIGFYFSALLSFFAFSFTRAAGTPGKVDFSGFENYAKFFVGSTNLEILGETFYLATIMTAAALLIAYPVAYLVLKTPSSTTRRILLFIIMGTFLSGGITRAYAWLILLGNAGLLNTLIMQLGFKQVSFLYRELGVGIAFVHFMVPFCTLTLIGGMQTIPGNLAEAATSLGASRMRTFWTVMFPLSVPAVIGAAVLTFSVAASAFLFPLLLGGGKVRLVANFIYELIISTFDIPYAAAVAVLFLLSTFALVAILPFMLKKVFWVRAGGVA